MTDHRMCPLDIARVGGRALPLMPLVTSYPLGRKNPWKLLINLVRLVSGQILGRFQWLVAISSQQLARK